MSGDSGVVRRRVVVRGVVQGVGFRASVAREAGRAGLAGFARNQGDGSVLIELEGRPDAVARVAAWCRRGPSGAEVTDVAVTELAPLGTAQFRTS
jgi:acylphosphatase